VTPVGSTHAAPDPKPVCSARFLNVPGAIAIIVVLILFPVVVLMSGAVGAAILGTVLGKDAEKRHAGSELIDLNR
jgi:hypothetical protein